MEFRNYMSDLKIIQGKELSPEELNLYNEIKSYVSFFDMLRLQSQEKYDKNYFILAFNLFDLGRTNEAIEVFNKITSGYFKNQLMKDIQWAFEQRNEAENYKNNPRKKDKYEACMSESEFVLVALGMPQYVMVVDNIHKAEFKDFLIDQFNNSQYTLTFKPTIGIVGDDDAS